MPDRSRALPNVLAGAGVGAVIGIVVGLAGSPVVSTILGSLSATLLGLLALKRDDADEQSDSRDLGAWRIVGFGFGCVVAIFAGITIRTHDLLAQDPAERAQKWVAAGFDKTEAKDIVLFSQLGVTPAAWSSHVNPSTLPTGSSSLMAGPAPNDCRQLQADRFPDPAERLNAVRLKGGRFEALAAAIGRLPPETRAGVLKAALDLACSENP